MYEKILYVYTKKIQNNYENLVQEAMEMQSIWSKATELPRQKELKGNVQVENIVIGAGMAGVLIAYFLQKQGKEVIVIEADKVADGQTKNTTAKITSQHGLCYYRMIKKAGKARAYGYAKANEEAIATYEKIINEEGIECQFERLPSFLYSTKEEGRELLAQETEAAKKLGIKAHFVPGNHIKELPFGITGAVCFERQAQFEPLAFIKAIAEKLTIYENTNAVFVHGHIVATNRGTIEAKNIVFAPQRLLIRAGLKDFFIDAGENVAGLTKGLFGKKEECCSHMGCHLAWNEEEKSWDCPCHGSRYDQNKKVIDNPAQLRE